MGAGGISIPYLFSTFPKLGASLDVLVIGIAKKGLAPEYNITQPSTLPVLLYIIAVRVTQQTRLLAIELDKSICSQSDEPPAQPDF